jgi:cytochrome c551/c552
MDNCQIKLQSMSIRLFSVLTTMAIILASCNQDNQEKKNLAHFTVNGIGKFQNIKLDGVLNPEFVKKGQMVFDIKCSACHKLTGEKLVGPGWKGVTIRHTPEWIMNFATNVNEMLANDPTARSQLDICLIRMPDQNLSDADARHVLEFMRMNDKAK